MEAAKESEPSRILDAILPPRLEVDGREGSALPPESFQDALARAAATVKSHAASIFTPDHRDDCMDDPWPVAEGPADVITGEPLGGHEPDQPCTTEKGSSGGRGQVGGDVVVPGMSGEGDEVVVVGKGAEEDDDRGACVDGLQGLEIGERGQNSGGDNGDEEGGDEEPILVLGVV
ncbi:uncharacterized protein LOC115684000 [Syzygium oleosum]|uniref:uncharacterized protein LOC115684000 n=1 Tax=Syzygium oleosum TaxID=219896 RepID=UPI0011D259BB|nr:uncharacterized protein LOC115684000 [Syzygium oleosum]